MFFRKAVKLSNGLIYSAHASAEQVAHMREMAEAAARVSPAYGRRAEGARRRAEQKAASREGTGDVGAGQSSGENSERAS